MDVQQMTAELWLQNEAQYLAELKQDSQWNSVPLLNVNDLHNLQHGRLVRFRGMVQDKFDPEFYFYKYNVLHNQTQNTLVRNRKFTYSLNKDSEEIYNSSFKNELTVCETLVMVSIPCLNDWAANIEKEQNKLQLNEQAGSSNTTKKRSLELEQGQMETESNDFAEASASGGDMKRSVRETSESNSYESNSDDSFAGALYNVPKRSGKACHAIIYDVGDEIKLNEMLEIVGFLSVEPRFTNSYVEDYISQDAEFQVRNPPSSLVPRINCVTWKKIKHNNPLVDGRSLSVGKMQSLKKELLILLTQLLCGDALAAEYLILHLISGIYVRRDQQPLGKFSLNFSKVPVVDIPDYGEKLYKFIELLVPKSHYFPLTLENLNNTAIIPEKDYQCGRLKSGLLQLTDNTHMVLDETSLNAGSLSAAAYDGLTAFVDTITNQKINYNFHYYPMEFHCDYPFLILSEAKSMLPTDFHVKLQPDQACISTFNEIVDAAQHFLKPELLNDLRVYLTLARQGEYDIPEDMLTSIQNGFAQSRQTSQPISAADLHQMLVLSRLVCLSEGKTSSDPDCWRAAMAMEEQRKGRLPNN